MNLPSLAAGRGVKREELKTTGQGVRQEQGTHLDPHLSSSIYPRKVLGRKRKERPSMPVPIPLPEKKKQ